MRTSTLGGLLALALVGFATTSDARGEVRPWTVDPAGEGAATRFFDGLPWQPLAEARALKFGEKLVCRDGCRVTAEGGSTLLLEASASMQAASPQFARLPADPTGLAQRCQVVRLLRGTLHVTHGAARSPLIVEAPNAAPIMIQSASALVRVAGGALVVIPNGAAAVKVGRKWVELTPKQAHVVRGQHVLERPPVVTPTWDVDAPKQNPIALAIEGPNATVQAAWHPVPSAVAYRVEVATDPGMRQVVQRLEVTESSLSTTLPEGRYWARVTPRDEQGLEAPPSAPRALRVVRALLPKGAYIAPSREILMPSTGRLQLLDPRGLEVSVGKRAFVPVLGAFQAPPRGQRLRIRLAGDRASTTTFRVARRTLEAHITLGPSAPVWPSDEVSIAVRLDDPTGRLVPGEMPLGLEVTVGGKLIAAAWTRSGPMWHTRVAGRTLGGPALLQVVARDPAGLALGRGFLELVAGPPAKN